MENEALIKTSTLIAIADAIRAANGGTQEMLPAEMEAFIRANSATTADIVDAVRSTAGDSAITAEQAAAYIVSNFVKPSVRQAAKTWTPGTSDQTIAADTYLTGAQTIKGDSNLAAGNIKKGVSIFGKTGTLSGVFGNTLPFASFSAVKGGEYVTVGTNIETNVTITHNLGVLPKFIMMYATEDLSGGNTNVGVLRNIMLFQTCGNDTISNSYGTDEGAFIYTIDKAPIAGGSNSVSHRVTQTKLNNSGSTIHTLLSSDTTTTFSATNGNSPLRATDKNFTLVLNSKAILWWYTTYKWLVMG